MKDDRVLACLIVLLLCGVWLVFYTGWPQALITGLMAYVTLRAILKKQQ